VIHQVTVEAPDNCTFHRQRWTPDVLWYRLFT